MVKILIKNAMKNYEKQQQNKMEKKNDYDG